MLRAPRVRNIPPYHQSPAHWLTAHAHRTALPQGIFGVPLQHSIRYANVAISLLNDEGQSYIYGYVPIVVAKCGVYLKEKGALTTRSHFFLLV